MNILFEYLYRDAGNYKSWNGIVFSNKSQHDPASLELRVKALLIDNEYFDASKAKVPDMRFKNPVGVLDHGWHEFNSIESTSDFSNDSEGRDIAEFICDLEYASTI